MKYPGMSALRCFPFRPWAAGAVVALGMVCGCNFKTNAPDGSGTIECTQVQVPSLIAGRIVALPPQEGAALKKGDLVGQIDTADLELKRQEARAALALAQAQLDLVQAGSRIEDVQRASNQVVEAHAAATAAQADLQRIAAVFAKNSATPKQRDDAQANADRTAALWAAAEQNYDKLRRGNRAEDIRIAQAQLDLSGARLVQIEKSIADGQITAPMDGVVTTRNREAGEYANAGTSLITLSRLDEVWLSIYIAEPRLTHVKLGQRARVRVNGDKRFYDGTVTFIAPDAEFTPKNVQTPDERAKLVYRIKITLRNREGRFKPDR
jgi:HlyD family secretion protein